MAQTLPLPLAAVLADAVEHCDPVREAAREGVAPRVGRGGALSLGEGVGRSELLRLSMSPREGDRGADAEVRSVLLTVTVREGRLEKDEEAVSNDDPLAEIDADSESRKDAVGSAAVAVAASEALPSEAEGVRVED